MALLMHTSVKIKVRIGLGGVEMKYWAENSCWGIWWTNGIKAGWNVAFIDRDEIM